MRTIDERVAAVERRVKGLEIEKRKKYYNLALLATAACLLLIVSIGIKMPRIMEGISRWDYTNNGIMASIFYEGKVLGYVFIGLLSFGLGVCITVLCFHLQPNRKKGREESIND